MMEEKDKKEIYDINDLKLDFSNVNNINWMSEHVLGIAKNINKDIKSRIQSCYNAECNETGMYLTMARQAYREGYPEIGNVLKQIAFEEAEHASRFLEMIQGPVSEKTEENLEALVKGEAAASLIRLEIAMLSKKYALEEHKKTKINDGENNKWSVYDYVHDSIHEISRDEGRHGRAFLGLLQRYFGNKKND